jgi:patatin-like phospholipase/acyl hydrolase
MSANVIIFCALNSLAQSFHCLNEYFFYLYSKIMKKILSLDGGGIRGIIPAAILAHLEARLQREHSDNNLRLAEWFDLMAGTSTGGILTCLYLTPSEAEPSKPKYSASQILDFYLELGPVLFHRSFGQLLFSGIGVFKSRYSEDALYNFSKKIMGDNYISGVMKDCLITSYEMSTRRALFFSKYNVKKYGQMADYKLSDIARATSAAPTYFTPAQIFASDKTPRHLVDGGVFANNPAMCAYVETVKIWPELSVRDLFMLSVGTGKNVKPYFWEKTHKWGYLNWLEPVIDILTSSVAETVDFQMQQLFSAAGVRENYIRIEPPLLSADSRMDNASPKNIRELSNAAQYFIDHNSAVFDSIINLVSCNDTPTGSRSHP